MRGPTQKPLAIHHAFAAERQRRVSALIGPMPRSALCAGWCTGSETRSNYPVRRWVQRHTVTLRRTPSLIYVAMRSNTASEILRARTNLSRSPSEPHREQVSVCSIVMGGECLISAWNLCSTRHPPLLPVTQPKPTAALSRAVCVSYRGHGESPNAICSRWRRIGRGSVG
jgi:hypothetical protein